MWAVDTTSQPVWSAYICLWHHQLKTITCALLLWPLSRSFFSPPSLGVWHSSIFSTQAPADWSGCLSLSSFSSSSFLCLGCYVFSSFFFFLNGLAIRLYVHTMKGYTVENTHAERCICGVRAGNNGSYFWFKFKANVKVWNLLGSNFAWIATGFFTVLCWGAVGCGGCVKTGQHKAHEGEKRTEQPCKHTAEGS